MLNNFVFVLLLFSHLVLSDSFATSWTVVCQAPLSMGFPGKNTGVGCHALLQQIFLSQGLNLHLLHCQADSLLLRPWGSPITLNLLPWISYLISYNLSIFFFRGKTFVRCFVGERHCPSQVTFSRQMNSYFVLDHPCD